MENIFTHWESVINFTRNDIVFEHQNKQYGAYAIRKYYPERLRNAFIYAIFIMLMLLGIPLLLQKLIPHKTNIAIPPDDRVISVTPYILPPVTTSASTAPVQAKRATEVGKKYKVVDAIELADNSAQEQDPVENVQPISNSTVSVSGSSNITATDAVTVPEPEPVLFAPVMPEFFGGISAMEKFLTEHIRYPRDAVTAGLSGRVYVRFVIDTKGRVTKAIIAKGIIGGELLETEALRVIRSMPDWKPGMNGGYPVAVQVTIPIYFVLE